MTTILLVESQPHHLAVGADLLNRGGYEVISASTAEDASDLVARFDPHLVLLDGVFSHPDTLRALGQSSVRPLSIVFSFVQGRGARLMEMLDVGATIASVDVIGFVEKPFQPDILMTTIDEGVRAAMDAVQPEPDSEDRGPFETTQRIYMSQRTGTREDETQVSEVPGSLYRALGLDLSRSDSRTMEPELPGREMYDATEEHHLPPATKRAHQLAERICAMMPERYPLHPSQMVAVASACEEALREEREEEAIVSGSLRGVPVFQVLQLAENLGPNAAVRFEHDDQLVEVFLRDRHVILARSNRRELSDRPTLLLAQTEELVYEALTMSDGHFSVRTTTPFPREAERSGIAIPLAGLLLEGLSRLDEWRRVSARELRHIDIGDAQ